jgi:hypothetical protein
MTRRQNVINKILFDDFSFPDHCYQPKHERSPIFRVKYHLIPVPEQAVTASGRQTNKIKDKTVEWQDNQRLT